MGDGGGMTVPNQPARPAAHFDAVILGAGAAGLFCALRAGQLGRRVLVLDRADTVGAKILISGGGRCNFTNCTIAPDRYLSENPHFCRSALALYTQHDFIALVNKHGITWHEKTLGQLFCDGSARQIVDLLLAECRAAQVDIRLGQQVTGITKPDRFRLTTGQGVIETPALVLATGGLSIPKMGATGFSYEVAQRFGLPLTPLRPALVPLTFDGAPLAVMQPLAGVALPVRASCGRQAFAESMVFTHRGLSGPAILQISSYWQAGQPVALNLLPGQDAASLLTERKHTRGKAELKTILGEVLPQRLAHSLPAAFEPAVTPTAPMGTLNGVTLKTIAAHLHNWQITPAGSEGYAKAEVTAGGVSTQALSSRTMMARDVPGLYVIGEAVDVTGWLGGYNFQWAWSSGWAAGTALGAM